MSFEERKDDNVGKTPGFKADANKPRESSRRSSSDDSRSRFSSSRYSSTSRSKYTDSVPSDRPSMKSDVPMTASKKAISIHRVSANEEMDKNSHAIILAMSTPVIIKETTPTKPINS